MTLRVVTTSTPNDAWRVARDAARVGPHLSDPWLAYRAAQGFVLEYAMLADERGETRAIGVVQVKPPRLRLLGRAQASVDQLPRPVASAAAAGVDADAVAAALVAHAREKRYAALAIESFDGPSPPPDLAALGCSVRERHEFLLALQGSAETRFAALKASHRRKVRDAEKNGVTVADETSPERIELLRELQGHTQERRTSRGEEMELPAPEQYERLARTFVAGGGGRLFVARLNGAPVSTILVGVNGVRAYYMMGGTSPIGFESNAATLLLQRAGDRLAENGVEVLNLGGVPRSAEQPDDPAHGLFRFKEGFGATRVPCASGRWPRDDSADAGSAS